MSIRDQKVCEVARLVSQIGRKLIAISQTKQEARTHADDLRLLADRLEDAVEDGDVPFDEQP